MKRIFVISLSTFALGCLCTLAIVQLLERESPVTKPFKGLEEVKVDLENAKKETHFAGNRKSFQQKNEYLSCKKEVLDLRSKVSQMSKSLSKLHLANAASGWKAEVAEGFPEQWGPHIRSSLLPKQTEQIVKEVIAKVGGELVDLECEEFPCMSYIKSPNDDPGWNQEMLAEMSERYKQEGFVPGVSAMGAMMDFGEGPKNVVGMTVSESESHDENLRRRATTRFDQYVSTRE